MRTISALAALCALLSLGACDGGQDRTGGGVPVDGLEGLVAVGAPVVGAEIALRCVGGDFATTSDGDGRWRVEVPEGATPCVIKAGGGTPPVTLYSYAEAPGTVNVTPLTTLAVAHAAGAADLSTWFDGANPAADPSLGDAVAGSRDHLLDLLGMAGYPVPAGLDPFTSRFEPIAGDPYDELLEVFGAALDRSGQDLDDILDAWRAGNPLPEAEGSGNGGIEDPDSTLQLLIDHAGTYPVVCTAVEPASRGMATRDHARGSITIAADGAVDFDTGITFAAADVNQLFDRTMLEGHSRRIHVNYDETDSGRKLEIYLDADLTITEISYSDGEGGVTRSAIGSDVNCDPGEQPAENDPELGASNGISARLDGVRDTHTVIISNSATHSNLNFIVKDAASGYTAGWQIYAQLTAGTQTCDGSSVMLGRYVEGEPAAVYADSCAIELTEFPEPDGLIQNPALVGSFSGIVTLDGASVTITDGVLQFSP